MIKKYAIKINFLYNKDVNYKNKIKNLKVKNEKNINMLIINLYLYAIIIIYKYLNKQDIIDC